MRNTRKPNAGFTMIETLVAIFIFGITLTATSFIMITNLNTAKSIRNGYIASGLVQEGIEVVRNMRDRDWFLNVPPGANPFGTTIPDGTRRVQWDSTTLIAVGVNPPLKKDSASGLYSYTTGTDTIFKRTITITTIIPNVEKRIVAQVQWDERGVTKSLSAEEHLFNWR